MRRIIFLFLPILWVIQACQKPDNPVDISPVPVFTADGTLNGDPASMAAGENGMYMFTFFRKENDGTYAYGGRMAKENCEHDCGPALEIFLIDTIPFVDQYGESRLWNHLDGVLYHGSVLNDPVRCEMVLSNKSYSPYGGLEETWHFNEGCMVRGKLKNDYLYFPSAGAVKTTLEVKDEAGNFASIQKSLNYFHIVDSGLKLYAQPCSIGRARLAVENSNDLPNLTYRWDDSSYGSSKCVNLGGYQVHRVTVAEGTDYETILSCSIQQSGHEISYLSADFGFDIVDHDFKIADAWPRVVIRYRDELGNWYDSRNTHQDDYCNYFSIKEVKPYHTDYQGNKTKKAEAFFSVTLKDNSQQCIELEHFHVQFGFGSRE